MQVSIGTEQFTIEVWCAHSAFENVSRSDSNRQADSFEPILMPLSAVATPVSLDIRVAQSDSRGGPARGLRTLRATGLAPPWRPRGRLLVTYLSGASFRVGSESVAVTALEAAESDLPAQWPARRALTGSHGRPKAQTRRPGALRRCRDATPRRRPPPGGGPHWHYLNGYYTHAAVRM